MENFEWHIIKLQQTTSTNWYIDTLDNNKPLPEGTVVTTHTQSAGRGQRGNSWEAAPGENLTFSYLLRPQFIAPQKQFILSQAAALAVVDVLSRYSDGFSVKWPNDIYHNNDKIAGILIENNITAHYISRSIIGIGLNINQQHFISNAPNPISLAQITGETYNTDDILTEILQATAMRYLMCFSDQSALQADYLNALYRKDGLHAYCDKNGFFKAFIETVLPDGHLILRDSDGASRKYAFKEVAFILR